ncbi:hypothetical protein [Leptolyngbya sp. 7M]|uniref:hypothetical protein n=1 Tax=Leptolyngbya sp. 7M TaxID=2812896 RepID=UPI001B8D2821|nr:hypothetical protein [Leptolyngbya sp. 7M]QYO67856.1 hypothetical protein JVX88_14360 [Leptolyngbya sp. 7M]
MIQQQTGQTNKREMLAASFDEYKAILHLSQYRATERKALADYQVMTPEKDCPEFPDAVVPTIAELLAALYFAPDAAEQPFEPN